MFSFLILYTVPISFNQPTSGHKLFHYKEQMEEHAEEDQDGENVMNIMTNVFGLFLIISSP